MNNETTIKRRRDFWLPKIERNMQGNKKVSHALAQKGFRVLRFWDHEVKKELGRCITMVIDAIEEDVYR
jgi:DNA mismatch endonuclease (patch repair protein)